MCYILAEKVNPISGLNTTNHEPKDETTNGRLKNWRVAGSAFRCMFMKASELTVQSQSNITEQPVEDSNPMNDMWSDYMSRTNTSTSVSGTLSCTNCGKEHSQSICNDSSDARNNGGKITIREKIQQITSRITHNQPTTTTVINGTTGGNIYISGHVAIWIAYYTVALAEISSNHNMLYIYFDLLQMI